MLPLSSHQLSHLMYFDNKTQGALVLENIKLNSSRQNGIIKSLRIKKTTLISPNHLQDVLGFGRWSGWPSGSNRRTCTWLQRVHHSGTIFMEIKIKNESRDCATRLWFIWSTRANNNSTKVALHHLTWAMPIWKRLSSGPNKHQSARQSQIQAFWTMDRMTTWHWADMSWFSQGGQVGILGFIKFLCII